MGFSMSELVEGKGWKKFMAKLYGWGASVVILGALFKIQHYPGAGVMLICGLTTEAVIFFFSAFEPIHEEIDWTLVYPELAGIDLEEEIGGELKKVTKQSALEKFDSLLEKGEITPELFERLGDGLRNLNQTTEKLHDVADATAATNNYVSNFEKASEKVAEFADYYGQSAQNLNQSAGKLSETYSQSADIVAQSASNHAEIIAQSADNYAKKMASSSQQLAEKFAGSGSELTGIISKTGEEVAEMVKRSGEDLTSSSRQLAEKFTGAGNELTGIISKTGSEVSELVKKSGEELALSYQQLTAAMNEEFGKSTEGTKTYGEQLEVMTKNLTALNAVYELQLQGVNEHLEATNALYGGLGQMMDNLNKSVEDTKRYRDEVSRLGNNLSALNTIYGNMLNAMNYTPVS
ncbi:MAG: gliding motility protein GldL [Bacteroidetes bacterium]|nr:gliding motility protein GldL [Bacteroidota bacterium]